MKCSICKSKIPVGDKSVNIKEVSTTCTQEIIANFVQKALKTTLADENICTLCHGLINELDYFQKRCKDICKHLLQKITSEKHDHDDEQTNQLISLSSLREELETVKDNELQVCCPENQQKQIPNSNRPKKQEKRKFKCELCLKPWRNLYSLKMHMLSHTNDRPHVCEICGKSYRHKKGLKTHIDMHNGINKFTCEYCNKSFTQKTGLERHLPLHTGETIYQCDLCGKRFLHHSSLSSHLVSHRGEKNFKCSTCNLSVSSASSLRRHMNSHLGERKHECETCGRKFAEHYNLIAHRKLHKNLNTQL